MWKTKTFSFFFSQGCDDTVNTKAFVDSITLGAFYIVGYVVYALFIKSVGRGVILGKKKYMEN